MMTRLAVLCGWLAWALAAGAAPVPDPEPAGSVHQADPRVIADRLAMVERVIAGGDRATGLAMLEQLARRYTGTAAFHERALALAVEAGDFDAVRTIGR